jgi:tRNA A-37 threonylcarbamoyl transferase component Bud32
MFEFRMSHRAPANGGPRPVAGRLGAPDPVLALALAEACALAPVSASELTIERKILRELPGERLVEQIALRRRGITAARAVAKTCADGRSLLSMLKLEQHSLPIPRLLTYLPEHRVLVMEEAQGERLDHLILAGRGVPAARHAGAAVAILHRECPAGLERITLEGLLGGLSPGPTGLPGALGERAAALAATLRALPDPIERRATLCHRDLHPRQIFDDGECVTLVDLDLIGLGHPALDLANFEVYLRVRHPSRADDLTAAFHLGYAAAERDPAAEDIYRAFTYLRLAVKTYRNAQPGWRELTARLLEDGRTALASMEARS